MKTNTKKLLSILLALMMMLSAVPFYASAAAETLTTSSVHTLPTITLKDPNVTTFYFGIKFSEIFSVADDEIVLDASGNQVAGHFEIRDTSTINTGVLEVKRLNLTFKPDDTDAYTTFNQNRVSVGPYSIEVLKADLVLVDAENDPPVTTGSVASGTAISEIAISGGAVYNKHYPDRGNYIPDWTWQDPTLIVTESGYYNAIKTDDYYNDLIVPVYVEVESSIVTTVITESPTATATFGSEWEDVKLEGGKALAGGEEITGTFSLEYTGTIKGSVGTYNIPVIFTPDDLEKYTPCEGTATVTVTKANYKFVNENGDVCVPEITASYGTTLEDVSRRIRAFIANVSNLTGADVAYISFPDNDATATLPVGTDTYNVRVRPSHEGNSNYNTTDLKFVLTIEPVVFTTSAYWGIDNVISGKLSHTVPGTFDIFVDGKLVGDDVNGGDGWSVDYPIPATGDYTIKVVYNPVENDNYSMVDYEKVVTAKIRRYITFGDGGSISKTVNGDSRMPIMKQGDTIVLSTLGGVKFLGWKITDTSGNTVDLGIADLMASEITFTMPDHDLIVTAEYQKENTDDGDGGFDIDNIFGDMTEGDSDCWLINIINNIIAKMKQIITTVTNLFRSIGDNT